MIKEIILPIKKIGLIVFYKEVFDKNDQ